MEHYISSSQKSRPDLYFVLNEVYIGDVCVLLWLWQSNVMCVYISDSFWVQLAKR